MIRIFKSIKLKYNRLLYYICSHLKAPECYYVGQGENLPPPLSQAEEEQLWKLRDSKPDYVRDTLIERNLRLVVYIARKFDNTGVALDDLISIGAIGLIKAVNTFDPSKRIKLATYASRCIENEILMHLRKTGKQKFEVSLDEPLNTDWDGNELLLSDVLGTECDIITRDFEEQDEIDLLMRSISRLKPREREILEMRYGLNNRPEMTQKQVADIMGISQSYISRLEKRILAELKRELTAV